MSNFVMLLVEDDSLQREVLSDLLKGEGFEVVECATAEAAELIVASTGKELRALITDHNLAGRMTGLELAEYARSAHPGLNIVLMSETVMHRCRPTRPFCTSRLRPPICWRPCRPGSSKVIRQNFPRRRRSRSPAPSAGRSDPAAWRAMPPQRPPRKRLPWSGRCSAFRHRGRRARHLHASGVAL